jgi:hypothetical protein
MQEQIQRLNLSLKILHSFDDCGTKNITRLYQYNVPYNIIVIYLNIIKQLSFVYQLNMQIFYNQVHCNNSLR